jgi:ParB family chromosome partitioning protein
MMIAIDLIDVPSAGLRTIAAGAAADAALRASVQQLGVLQPILVRDDGGRYTLLAGRRRLHAARETGRRTIPAEVCDLLKADALAAEGAENMVRAPMDAVDQWALMQNLAASGYSPAAAEAALGLSQALAARMRLLGKLHPDLRARMAGGNIPPMQWLSIIANAPADVQKRAAKAKEAKPAPDGRMDWHALATACKVTRICQTNARFDVAKSKVIFTEDLFAEPGSDEQFTTTDVPRFLADQRAWMAEQVKKGGALIGTFERYTYVLPDGWLMNSADPTKKLRKGDKLLLILADDLSDPDLGEITTHVIFPKPATAPLRPAASEAGAASPKAATPPAEPRAPITKAGAELVRQAQTAALRACLRDPATGRAHGDQLAAALALTLLCADNVNASSDDPARHTNAASHSGRDIARRLVMRDGTLAPPDGDLGAILAEALARVLVPGTTDGAGRRFSGAVAAWIGAALGADAFLPRFDTPAILATVNATELHRAAALAGLKPAKTAAGLRLQLAGNAPGATFHAPGPPEPEMRTPA